MSVIQDSSCLGAHWRARHLEVVLSLCHDTVLCTCLLPEVVTGFVEGTLDHGTQESRKDMGDIRDYHEISKGRAL